jgi:hypothetical protein
MPGDVNPFHRRKATSFPRSPEQATEMLVAGLLAVKDGGVTLAKMAFAARPNVVQAVVNTYVAALQTLDTWTDLSGMTVTITPSSTASKVLVTVSVIIRIEYLLGGVMGALRLVRGSTPIAGNAGGTPATLSVRCDYGHDFQYHIVFLDSPASAAATTYKLQGYIYWDGSGSSPTTHKMWVNGTNADDGISTITAQEVHAV